MSHNYTQRQAGSIDGDGQTTGKTSPGFHHVKHHGYAYEDFAEAGEVTQFNGIRVIDESGSGDAEEFENFDELQESCWTVKHSSAARLNDGTILYEGQR
jgi:hypothetical protein